jgi:SAM-dependent methyltransferase
MREAENYNRYLVDLILDHGQVGRRVVDFGAGAGTFAERVAALGLEVTAVEPDDHLRGLLAERGIRAVAAVADLADRSFDYAYTLNVLEHIEDDVAALRDLHALVAGGLLVYVPAFPILYTSMDAKVGHVRRYTRASLTACVSAAGYRIEKVAYADSLGFFATLLFKAAGNRSGDVNPSMLRLYDRFVFPVSRLVDKLMGHWFGKNLLLVARKPA